MASRPRPTSSSTQSKENRAVLSASRFADTKTRRIVPGLSEVSKSTLNKLDSLDVLKSKKEVKKVAMKTHAKEKPLNQKPPTGLTTTAAPARPGLKSAMKQPKPIEQSSTFPSPRVAKPTPPSEKRTTKKPIESIEKRVGFAAMMQVRQFQRASARAPPAALSRKYAWEDASEAEGKNSIGSIMGSDF